MAKLVRIDQNSPSMYLMEMFGRLRAVPLSPTDQWSTPAKWIEVIDHSDCDLAALKLTLYLAWPDPDDKRCRADVAAKTLAHWQRNAGGPMSQNYHFDKRPRENAINKMENRASTRIEIATNYLNYLILAAGAGSLMAGMLNKGYRSNLIYRGPAGAKGISRGRAEARGLKPKSARKLRREEWRDARPVLHLAWAVSRMGGIGALFKAGRLGDTAALSRLLDDAECTRRLMPGMVPFPPNLSVEDMIQFRPAESI